MRLNYTRQAASPAHTHQVAGLKPGWIFCTPGSASKYAIRSLQPVAVGSKEGIMMWPISRKIKPFSAGRAAGRHPGLHTANPQPVLPLSAPAPALKAQRAMVGQPAAALQQDEPVEGLEYVHGGLHGKLGWMELEGEMVK